VGVGHARELLKLHKTKQNRLSESNNSSSALKSEGRKFDRFALFRMI